MNRWLLLGFALILGSAVLRALAPITGAYYHHILLCVAVLWVLGFGVVLVQIGPSLWSKTRENVLLIRADIAYQPYPQIVWGNANCAPSAFGIAHKINDKRPVFSLRRPHATIVGVTD